MQHGTARRPLTPVPPLITISAQAFTAAELAPDRHASMTVLVGRTLGDRDG